MTIRGWMAGVFTYHTIKNYLGTVFPQRGTIRLGSGFSVQDDAVNAETVIDVSGGTGGSGGGEDLQDAYDLGGTIDANVASSANILRVRAADLVADVLLLFRRKVTSEQTIFKAPDAITTGVGGTDLVLASGAGKAGTGSTDGTDSGALYLAVSPPGSSVNGNAGSGGPAELIGAKGANATGTGEPGAGSPARLVAGAGGDSGNDAVASGDGGDAEVVVGFPGDPHSEGSASGAQGKFRVKNTNGDKKLEVDTNSLKLFDSPSIRYSTVTPIGNVTGNPGDLCFHVFGSAHDLYRHVGSSANNTSWVRIGPLSFSETLVIPQSLAIPNSTNATFDLTSTSPTNRPRWLTGAGNGVLLYPLRGTVPNGAKVTACKCKLVPGAAETMNVALVKYDANFASAGTLPLAGTVIGNQNSDGTVNTQVTTLSGLTEVIDYSTYEYFVKLTGSTTGSDRAYGCAVTFNNP